MRTLSLSLATLFLLACLTGCSGTPDDFQGHWSFDMNNGATHLFIDSSAFHYVMGNNTKTIAYEFIGKGKEPGSILIQLPNEAEAGIMRQLALSEDKSKLVMKWSGEIFEEAKEILNKNMLPAKRFTRVDDKTRP